MPFRCSSSGLVLLIFILSNTGCFSQVKDPDSSKNEYRIPIPYANLRQADVTWSKRIWRRIDLRKKQNQVFYYPEEPAQGRKNLFDIIRYSLLTEGTLTAYDPGTVVEPDDEFTRVLSKEELLSKMINKTEVDIFDEYGEIIGTETVKDTLLATAIKFYEIKEEWFFENQKSQLESRIIGLKPIVEKEGADGEPVLEDLFWIYFPEARFVFARNDVYNRNNDAERMSYDDLFLKRLFESTIIKESNVYDRTISQYKTGLDALLEAEMIEERIFNLEHDFWHY